MNVGRVYIYGKVHCRLWLVILRCQSRGGLSIPEIGGRDRTLLGVFVTMALITRILDTVHA